MERPAESRQLQCDDISVEIARIEEELANIKGTPCEIYSRVVGYHRPIQNWNKGKQEEFKDRVTFRV